MRIGNLMGAIILTAAMALPVAAKAFDESKYPDMQAQWTSSTPREWANETFAIAKATTTGYCVMHGPSCDPAGDSFVITTEYLESNRPAVREQLLKAAYYEVLRDSAKVENYYAKKVLDSNGLAN